VGTRTPAPALFGLGGALGFGPLHGGFERRHGAQQSDPRGAERIPLAAGRSWDESRASCLWRPAGMGRKGRGKGGREATDAAGRRGAGDLLEKAEIWVLDLFTVGDLYCE